ncbi:MAG: hypothetical protein ABIF85_00865 [Nanoarchaeota archaeon]|nr:hypothetical protein [Nanoarchaeota archaeon]MBU4451959.1 hypothetical protein [Nanoarchaeota archaeon]MCG2724118.1 hypothetical protein [archaeon]
MINHIYESVGSSYSNSGISYNLPSSIENLKKEYHFKKIGASINLQKVGSVKIGSSANNLYAILLEFSDTIPFSITKKDEVTLDAFMDLRGNENVIDELKRISEEEIHQKRMELQDSLEKRFQKVGSIHVSKPEEILKKHIDAHLTVPYSVLGVISGVIMIYGGETLAEKILGGTLAIGSPTATTLLGEGIYSSDKTVIQVALNNKADSEIECLFKSAYPEMTLSLSKREIAALIIKESVSEGKKI